MTKNRLGFPPTALVTLKAPVGLKVPFAMLVQLDRGSATLVELRTWKVPLSGPLVPLNIRLAPERVTLLMPGLDTTGATTTRFTLPPLTEMLAVAPAARPVPVTLTA